MTIVNRVIDKVIFNGVRGIECAKLYNDGVGCIKISDKEIEITYTDTSGDERCRVINTEPMEIEYRHLITSDDGEIRSYKP